MLSNWRKRLAVAQMTQGYEATPAFVDIGSMASPVAAVTLRLDLGSGLVLTVTRS